MEKLKEKNCVIVDMESLGTHDDAIILDMALNIVDFSTPPETNGLIEKLRSEQFYMKFDVKEQYNDLNRVKTQTTMDWWKEQSDKAKQILKITGKEESVKILPTKINEYFEQKNVNPKECFWLQRGFIDLGWIAHIYERTLGLEEPPFAFWNGFDIKSLLLGHLNTPKFDIPEEFIDTTALESHSSKDDVILDILRIYCCFYA